MPHKTIAIAGIHTGTGKTVVSAILTEAFGADYWKPVQAGINERDLDFVKAHITNNCSKLHPEQYLLTQPLSPHQAAAIDGVEIAIKGFAFPETDNNLIVETAGGVLSPICANATMADFIAYYKLPLILVANNYLGSINHTLLSIEALRSRGLTLLGLVINGAPNPASESFIEQYAKVPILARVPDFEILDRSSIIKYAQTIKQGLLADIFK